MCFCVAFPLSFVSAVAQTVSISQTYDGIPFHRALVPLLDRITNTAVVYCRFVDRSDELASDRVVDESPVSVGA